jgi:hypothetical protein
VPYLHMQQWCSLPVPYLHMQQWCSLPVPCCNVDVVMSSCSLYSDSLGCAGHSSSSDRGGSPGPCCCCFPLALPCCSSWLMRLRVLSLIFCLFLLHGLGSELVVNSRVASVRNVLDARLN